MKRTTLNVFPTAKLQVKDIQKHLNLSNESETVAYLTEFYSVLYEKLTFSQHEKIKQKVKEQHDQVSL